MEPAPAPPVSESEEATETGRDSASVTVLTTAELSPCTCPDACERDHDRD